MYPARFEYYRANTLQEAIHLLQQHSGAKLLAGGHSLIPIMKLRLAQPPVLIDIGRISELSGVMKTDGRLRIGSLTTHAMLAASEAVKKHCPILAEAAGQIADPAVRNKGTIGGNLAHADPGSDLPAVTLALDGVIHITGRDGDRQVNASDFFLDLLTTDLKPEEVLTAVELPALEERTGSCYLKFEHPASGYAVCGAAAIVALGGDESCERAGLCFNGVTATPYRASAVTEALAGQNLEDATIDQAVTEHLSIDDPMGDTYASGPYRVELAKVYSKRALKTARDRARS
ncbi:xanthine dehydrogenase family protein subunit M [Acidobacteria bacterium AH-259-G07]|nr:xanthine dehydrogenase family protein subunit M [Acidobacteria bacterium AH-259-G07]